MEKKTDAYHIKNRYLIKIYNKNKSSDLLKRICKSKVRYFHTQKKHINSHRQNCNVETRTLNH